MRTEGDFIKINKYLSPLSWLYGLGVRVRNLMFDMGILKSESFNIPVISVGNITVGGSGKTPHVEYLIRLLKDHVSISVLSRGYKRKTHGYLLAKPDSKMSDIGDEPYQMKKKFTSIHVAVDSKRTRGISHIIHDKETCDTDVVLLDDAFQHRYVKPDINILLVDYHRLIIYDELLPAGRLREPATEKKRADIVIVTKCPKDLKPMEYRVLTKAMNLYPFQELYFTSIEYNELTGIYNGKTLSLKEIAGKKVILLTGIASPKQIINDLTPFCSSITSIAFGDHHAFTKKDIEYINSQYLSCDGDKLIITTEKDATRFTETCGLSNEVKSNIYTLPIHITFMLGQGEKFNRRILNYMQMKSPNGKWNKTNKGQSKSKDSSKKSPQTISFRNN